MGSPDFWRLVGVVGFFRDVVSGRAVQGSRVGLGGIRFLRVWHDCVRLCVGRCRRRGVGVLVFEEESCPEVEGGQEIRCSPGHGNGFRPGFWCGAG
ncbi:hypothetical protein Ddc_18898 [Ditylenchus destructor]|nr:hypothetical protein Ddc_18898 [Ditylenchus destructor]